MNDERMNADSLTGTESDEADRRGRRGEPGGGMLWTPAVTEAYTAGLRDDDYRN